MNPGRWPTKTCGFTINNFTAKDVEWCQNIGIQVNRMVASKEVGEGGTPHIQGYFTLKKATRFGPMKKLHSKAHWFGCKVEEAAALYPLKADSEIIVNVNYTRQGNRTDLDSAIEDAAELSARELWLKHAKTMVRYSKGILQYSRIKRAKIMQAKYALEDFKWPAIEDWKTSYIIWGDAGIGKTEFAKAHFKNPLFVCNMDDLKDFSEDHDGIIFDDMDFKHIPREAQIHILDVDNPRTIKCRYENAVIPAGTKKIFTTNVAGGWIFDLNDAAVLRRVTRRHVTVTEVEEGNTNFLHSDQLQPKM